MIKKFLRDNPIHKQIAPYLDFIFLLRPTLFFAVWVMTAIGMTNAHRLMGENPIWINQFHWETVAIFVGLSFATSATFILNQLIDVKSDSINQKLFIIEKLISEETAKIMMFRLSIIGLILLFIGNWIAGILGVILIAVWGFLYNKKPFEWKKHYILGLLCNSLAGLILYGIGWIYIISEADLSISFNIMNFILPMIPYIFCFSAVSILTNIPDIKGDEASNINTLPMKIGRQTSAFLSTLFVIIALYLALINNDPIASTASITSLPFFIFAAIRNLDKDILRAIRYPIFLLNFFVMAVYPWLIPPVLIVYYMSKYYYWHRFDLHYPTFMVEHD